LLRPTFLLFAEHLQARRKHRKPPKPTDFCQNRRTNSQISARLQAPGRQPQICAPYFPWPGNCGKKVSEVQELRVVRSSVMGLYWGILFGQVLMIIVCAQALATLEACVKQRWKVLPPDQRELIKSYIVNVIVRCVCERVCAHLYLRVRVLVS